MNIPLNKYLQLLNKYLKLQWGKVILLMFLVFGGIGVELVNPLVIRYFLDTAQSGGSMSDLLKAAGVFILLAVLVQVFSVSAIYLGENIGWTATNELREDLVTHCLRLDMAFHKRRTPGELIERIDGDVTELANFFSLFFARLVGNLILILGVLVLLTRVDWRIGLGVLAYVLLNLLALQSIRRRSESHWEASRQADAELSGYLEERLAGTEDIRSSGAETHVLNGFFRHSRNAYHKFLGAHMMGVWSQVLTNSFYIFGYALGMIVGGLMYLNGMVTIGTAYLILYYIGILTEPIQAVRYQVTDLQRASASISRVQELLGFQPDIPVTGDERLPKGKLSVSFAGVSFTYQDDLPQDNGNGNQNGSREHVLKDISFELSPGRILGLLGRTGSGKTTLTRLLYRLYDPVVGNIRLGNLDIRTVPLSDIRKGVGVVTQDVQLFQASLRDNITLFDRQVPDEKLTGVLRELGLWDWFSRLPQGLETRLGSNGVGLSAGEAQILALARVFLRDPGVVILDEASSRLDPATETMLEVAVNRLLQGRTGLIIAHRLRTVQRADDILILDDGHIREYGKREELARSPASIFSQLLKTGMEEALV